MIIMIVVRYFGFHIHFGPIIDPQYWDAILFSSAAPDCAVIWKGPNLRYKGGHKFRENQMAVADNNELRRHDPPQLATLEILKHGCIQNS